MRNFRNLDMEEKLIFSSHAATIFLCFFPWIALTPVYGVAETFNAFSGPTKLMGWLIFLLSLVGIAFFADKILQKKWLKFSIPNELILGFGSFQQVILLICIWSVLVQYGQGFENSEILFGLFLCFFAQVLALAATHLLMKKGKKKAVEDFFTTPHSQKNAE